MSVECGSCGMQLSEEFTAVLSQACPGCGSTSRVFSLLVSDGVGISVSAVASQRYGHTGREVRGAAAEQRAIEWASAAQLWRVATRHRQFQHRAVGIERIAAKAGGRTFAPRNEA